VTFGRRWVGRVWGGGCEKSDDKGNKRKRARKEEWKEGRGQIRIHDCLCGYRGEKRKKGEMSGGEVQCGRHSRGDGEVHVLVIIINTSNSFHFPFFAPNSTGRPAAAVSPHCHPQHKVSLDKVSLDHPFPSVSY